MNDCLQRKGILQKLVSRQYLVLLDLVKARLTDFEKELLELVMPRYVKGCRWYDPYHVLYSTLFLLELCEKEKLDRSVLIPAIILHDVGYSTLTSGKGGEAIVGGTISADGRLAHMKAGVEITAEIFAELRNRGFVSETMVEKTVQDVIATHDNPYIGLALETPLEEQHREADRIFVMSFVSFAKDYLRYLEEGKGISVHDFFILRLASFSKPSGFEEAYDFGVQLLPEIWETYKNRYEPLHVSFSQKVNKKQFVMRLHEIRAGLFTLPLRDFEEACRLYLEKEMELMTRLGDV